MLLAIRIQLSPPGQGTLGARPSLGGREHTKPLDTPHSGQLPPPGPRPRSAQTSRDDDSNVVRRLPECPKDYLPVDDRVRGVEELAAVVQAANDHSVSTTEAAACVEGAVQEESGPVHVSERDVVQLAPLPQWPEEPDHRS